MDQFTIEATIPSPSSRSLGEVIYANIPGNKRLLRRNSNLQWEAGVKPGTLIAIMAGSGAGTNWIVNASMTWAELDWPVM